MKSRKRTAFLSVLFASCLLFSCAGGDVEVPPAPTGESDGDTGYFTDERDALDELEGKTDDVKTEWEKKSGVSRDEWRLTEEAVDRYYLPLTRTDYYYYDDVAGEEVVSGDPLTRIFLEEWGEYRFLAEAAGTTREMTPEQKGEIDALAAEAEVLLSETPPIHRDLVRRIIGIRYRTTLLKAGMNPEATP